MFLDMLGFTYVTNPGLYVSQNISDLTIFILQIFVVSVWILLLYSIKYYQKILGRSILIDLSFAFITTGLLGNLLIDRLLLGYIRDYLVLPFGVANLADFCGQIAILLLSIHIFRSPQFRNLLLRVQYSMFNLFFHVLFWWAKKNQKSPPCNLAFGFPREIFSTAGSKTR